MCVYYICVCFIINLGFRTHPIVAIGRSGLFCATFDENEIVTSVILIYRFAVVTLGVVLYRS